VIDSHGFDLWAGDYDRSVSATDDDNLYPFAGYRALMNAIYRMVMRKNPATVLDIGIGTGILAAKLYECGHHITGIDFSSVMLDKAKKKMPDATFIEHDFTKGLSPDLQYRKFDFIISTYALHHLTDEEKTPFILSVLNHVNDNGAIIIGDVSFQNRSDLEKCKSSCGDKWDDNESYFVFSELNETLVNKCCLIYHQISYCSGIVVISPLNGKI